MKAQINRNNKSNLIFSLDFNVKNPNVEDVPTEILEQEDLTWQFREWYCEFVFGKIKNFSNPECWILSGRSNGWYTVCFLDSIKPSQKQIETIEEIVTKYFEEYSQHLKEFYDVQEN